MQSKIYTLLLLANMIQLHANSQTLRDQMLLNLPFYNSVKDYSGFDHDGTLNGTTMYADRFGNTQSAIYFDGQTDMVEIAHSEMLKPALPITISMWIYPEEVTSVNNKLFTSDDSPDFYSGVSVQIDPNGTGAIACGFGTGGGSGSQNRRSAIGTIPVQAQTWSHITVVIKGAEDMEIYVNGQKDSVNYSGTGGNLVYSEHPTRIGAFDGNVNGDPKYFNGAIDDLKMWNASLEQEDIAAIYSELIWDMPVNDSQAIDYSGNMIDCYLDHASYGTDRFGNENNAFQFSGDSGSVEAPFHPMLKASLPISVSYWVKADDINNNRNVLFTNDDHPDFYSGIAMRLDHLGTGTASISYGTGGGSGPDNRRTGKGQIALESEQWYHIVGICRGPEDMDIYVNGVKDSLTYSGNGGELLYTDMPGRIGAYDGNIGGPPKYFAGQLDEFKMWNRSISEEEILALYTPGINTNTQEPNGKLSSTVYLSPNPVSGELRMNTTDDQQFEYFQIVDLQGQTLKRNVLDSNMIEVYDLPEGLYFLQLYSSSQTITKSFIKAAR